MLKGKNIIVTGAAGGIGRALVRYLVENGAFVWACCRCSRPDSDAFLAGFGDRVESVYFDLNDESSVDVGIKSILKQKKPIHGLVNNAGMVTENRLFSMTPMSAIRAEFEVNFFSQLLITQLIIRGMMRTPEESHSIVMISSVAALDGDPGQLEYVASKAALIGVTKKLARELSPQHIRVNAIAPGVIDTGMIAGMSEIFKRDALSRMPSSKVGKLANIAALAGFLLSDNAFGVNGEIIRAEG